MYNAVCFLIVFSFNLCLCFESAWYSYQNEFLGENREELVITSVEEDEHFSLNNSVKKWRSLNIGPVCYSAGITENSIILLTSTLVPTLIGFNISSQEIEFEEKPSDVILLHNRVNGHSEIIAVVTFYNTLDLKWFKIQKNQLVQFWSFPMESPVLHINYYRFLSKDLLLVVHNENNETVANLYEFNLKFKKPKRTFLASLDLEDPVTSSAFNNFDTELYLSVPHQKTSVVTYKFENNIFTTFQKIDSPKIQDIVSFEIGFKSYLAIDGYNVGIYEISTDGWVRQNISNSNMDNIHYWLPVPVQTYRDEVILFAQRSLDHVTHKAHAVEIITNNGGKFEEHEDIPCQHLGEKSEWLTCLAQDSGIIGSSYIYIDNTLGLIVPRPARNSSDLFLIHYEIKQISHPKEQDLAQLLVQQEILQELFDSQLKEYEDLKNLQAKKLSEPEEMEQRHPHEVGKARVAEDTSDIKDRIKDLELELKEVSEKVDKIIKAENKTTFDTIIINGNVVFENIQANDLEIETIRDVPATAVLEDIVSKDNLVNITGNKTFTDLSVDNLVFQEANNGINSNDFVSKKDLVLTLNGDIIFEGLVTAGSIDVISGNINDINFSSEVITMPVHNGSLQFEDIEVVNDFIVNELRSELLNKTDIANETTLETESLDTLEINENVTVIFLNSLNFTEFLNKLCFINTSCYIPGNMTVDGNITAKETYTEHLNDLQFPQEYIFMDTLAFVNITGHKIFKSDVFAEEMQATGEVSGVNPDNLLTKTTDQEISGEVTFENLEITEELNVTGKILGDHITQFLSNPTLETVKTIKSNVNFKKLEVEGNIIIENNFNGQNFSSLLNEVVYKDEENVTITGNKEFSSGLNIEQNLEIETGSINNIKLASLITKDTDQDLKMKVLKGDVTIKNLYVHGKYDGKNISQLDETFVKLSGEQFISSTLIFNDDIHVENLEITEKLNDVEADEYLYTTGDAEINVPINFDSIIAENLHVDGNLHGNIMDLDLDDAENKYLTLTSDQIVNEPFEIQHVKVDNLETEHCNFKDEDLIDSKEVLEEVWKILNNGSADIENLVVDGFLQIRTINDVTADSLFPKSHWDNKNMSGNITIEGDLFVNELEIDKLSSFNWNRFVELLVFKNETSVVLNNTKYFTNNFTVEKLIETTKINNVLLENVLRKDGAQHIRCPMVIEGNTVVENMAVADTINSYSVGDILKDLEVSDNTFVLNGDMVFEKLAYIEHLDVTGTLNNKNIEESLSDIVFLNKDAVLGHHFDFREPVEIVGNLTVSGNINDITFIELAPEIVLATENTTIEGPISFNNSVLILDSLNVDGDMATKTLFGIDTNEWLNKAVFVNRGLLNGTYTFENITIADELTTKFINDVNMDNIVPLNTDQNIDQLEFEEVTVVKDVEVEGLVNGVQLPEEVLNTVMSNLEQEILTDVIFRKNVLIRENLWAKNINDNDASTIVTTNTDQELNGLYNFNSQCVIYSDLEAHELINGINISLWKNNLKLFSPEVQTIDSELFVDGNITFNDNVEGVVTIDDFNLESLAEEVEKRRNYKYTFETGIIADYNNICTDVIYLHQKTKNQIYKFKYFEHFQEILFRDNLQNVFFYEFQDSQYLLASEENCRSHLYTFNSTGFILLHSNIDTGNVLQAIPVFANTDDTMYLVLRGNENKCTINGTNIWEFDSTSGILTLKYKLEDHDLIQESLIPNTFYGLQTGEVSEYIVDRNNYRIYRKWITGERNAAFVPRGLQTGLALRTGEKIVFLDRAEPVIDDEYDLDSTVILRGSSNVKRNPYMPGRSDNEIEIIPVGIKSARKNLLAVTDHISTVRKNIDIIKIYENPLEGDVLQEIRADKLSSLISIDFEQGETLLAFLENQRTLEIYEYKGIEGFQHRSSAKINGSKMFRMTLPIKGHLNKVKALGIIDNRSLKIIQSVMMGNKIEDNFVCGV